MKKNSGIFLALFGSVFLIVGLVMGYFNLMVLDEAVSMCSWNEVQSRIISCDLSSHRGSKGGSTFSVQARYDYSVNGVKYTGDRVGLSSGSDNIGSFHQDQYNRLLNAKNKGKPVSCWVNPDNPADSILVRKPRVPLIVFKMMFVLIFGAVGLCICMTGLFMVLTPDISSGDFLQNRIRMRGAHSHKAAAAVAILWNFYTVWVLLKLVRILSAAEIPFYLWAVCCSGLIPAAVALYLVLRINKYGISFFELSPVPGVLGGPVTGNIRIPKSVQAPDGFELILQCIHQYTTRSGKNSTTHKDVLWDSHCNVDTMYNYGSEMVVPVKFHAPYNKPATTASGGANGYYWQLRAKAKAPGIDYNAVFDVPVKKTAQSREEYSERDSSEPFIAEYAQSLEQVVQASGLGYKWFGDNSYAIDFRACRILSAVLFLGLFAAICTGVCLLMASKAAWFFVSVFIFFDFFLLSSFLTLLFVSVRLIINENEREIRIEKRFAGVFFSGHNISFSEMDIVEYERGMQSGSIQYYRVVVTLVSGKRVKIGSGIGNRVCAKRIADELNRLMNEHVRENRISDSADDFYTMDYR